MNIHESFRYLTNQRLNIHEDIGYLTKLYVAGTAQTVPLAR